MNGTYQISIKNGSNLNLNSKEVLDMLSGGSEAVIGDLVALIEKYKKTETELAFLLDNRNYVRRKKFDAEVKGSNEQKEILWNLVFQKSDIWLKQELANTRELLDSFEYLIKFSKDGLPK